MNVAREAAKYSFPGITHISEDILTINKLFVYGTYNHTKIVSMIRKYHYHKLQTNHWHREEEPHNNHETPGRQTKQATSSLVPIEMIAKLEWIQSNAQQIIEQLQNPTINSKSTTTVHVCKKCFLFSVLLARLARVFFVSIRPLEVGVSCL